MKLLSLEDEKHVITKKDDNKQQFTMENQHLFISMYRDTTYKNKLRVIPQEYMSNARDAHREIGKDDVPIEITLPTKLDPILTICDYGVGISEERSKIFSAYGASTKRGSDKENGGFGIGCKCAWSYTESFTIDTVFEDNGKKINRVYSVYITSKLDPGNIRVVSEFEVPRNTPTGTKICIPIMDGDIENVISSVHTTYTFWEVKPKLTNATLVEGPISSLSGNKWSCYQSFSLFGIIDRSFVVIDGICYNIDLNLLVSGRSQYEDNGDGDVKEVRYSITAQQKETLEKSRIVMFFDVGEVDVAPDRENLDYNVKTIKKLHNKINEVINQLIIDIKSEIVKEDANFYSILLAIDTINATLDVELLWNGIDVIKSYNQLKEISCSIVTRSENKSFNHFPFDQFPNADRTAILCYSSFSVVLSVTKRLLDDSEYFDALGCDRFVLFSTNENSRYGKSKDRSLLKGLITHKRIQKPRIKTPKIKLLVNGIFDRYDNSINSIEDLGENPLFVFREYSKNYLFRGCGGYSGNGRNYKISDLNELSVLFPNNNIYAVDIRGRAAIRRHNIKMTMLDDYIVSAVVNEVKKPQYKYNNINSYNFSTSVRGFIKRHHKELFQWIDNGNAPSSLKNAIKYYTKLYNISVSSKKGMNECMSLAKFLDIKIDVLDKDVVESLSATIKKQIPFIDHCSCLPHNIIRNILLSYKEHPNVESE